MAVRKRSKKTRKSAIKRRVVPSTISDETLKLKFTKVVNGVTFATVSWNSGEACAADWSVPSRCFVHGEVSFDGAVVTANLQGVEVRGE